MNKDIVKLLAPLPVCPQCRGHGSVVYARVPRPDVTRGPVVLDNDPPVEAPCPTCYPEESRLFLVQWQEKEG